jgi:hypothetical protein
MPCGFSTFSMYGLAVSPFFAIPTTLGDPKKKSSLTKALGSFSISPPLSCSIPTTLGAVLEGSMNPFATVVMAHLKAQETKSKAEERRVWKYELMRALYDKQYNESQIVNLFKFIDWFIILPEKLENSFWNDLKTLEEEKKMTFVTSVERIGYKRGQKETLEKSKKQTEEMVLKLLEDQVSLDIIVRATGLANEKIQSQQK